MDNRRVPSESADPQSASPADACVVRNHRGGFCSAAGMFCLYAFFLLLALHIVGTSSALFFHLQMKAEILPEAGISESALRRADDALAKYLAGDAAALTDSPFNETEIAHMADCFDLFALLRRVIAACGGIAILCLIVGRGRKLRFGARTSALALLALLIALAIWGIADFDALFTAFHRLLFSNELWLLNPETDLLIRICPESMFAAMAAIILGATLVFIGVCILLTSMGGKKYAEKL